MKIIPGFKVCGLILAAAFFAGLGFGTSASAQSHAYLIDLNSKTATDIGTLGGSLAGCGINDAGQVVGYSDTAGGATHAFITGPDGVGMRDLGLWMVVIAMLGALTTPARSWVILTTARRRLPCFHHRPRRDGYERPWHFGW